MFYYALYFFKNYTTPMAYMIIMAFLEDIGGYFLNENVLANLQSRVEWSNCVISEKKENG